MKWKPTQDSILLIAGLLGLLHETVMTATADPVLVGAFCAMCGVPFIRAKDRDDEDKKGR